MIVKLSLKLKSIPQGARESLLSVSAKRIRSYFACSRDSVCCSLKETHELWLSAYISANFT